MVPNAKSTSTLMALPTLMMVVGPVIGDQAAIQHRSTLIWTTKSQRRTRTSWTTAQTTLMTTKRARKSRKRT